MSGYPMIDALNATHPLTPREKVAQIIKEKVSGPHFSDPSHFVAMEQDRFAAADTILTALASGSGDHAELARLAEAAICCEDANYPAIRGDFGKAANPTTVLALLAEIAALRAERDAKDLEIGRVIFRATEAERKLAEAYRTARQFLAATSGTTYPSNHLMWAAIESAQQLLSKEAERG